MKVESESLLPLVLDFIGTHFSKEDLKAFKKYFKIKTKHKDDSLVKAGGLSAMLQTFFKHNKTAYRDYLK